MEYGRYGRLCMSGDGFVSEYDDDAEGWWIRHEWNPEAARFSQGVPIYKKPIWDDAVCRQHIRELLEWCVAVCERLGDRANAAKNQRMLDWVAGRQEFA